MNVFEWGMARGSQMVFLLLYTHYFGLKLHKLKKYYCNNYCVCYVTLPKKKNQRGAFYYISATLKSHIYKIH